METSVRLTCSNCNKQLPINGYFCGSCLIQYKCKTCETVLEKDDIGCTNCGTPRVTRYDSNTFQNTNTYRYHETKDERTIEATFSDTVGKDLSGILRDTFISKNNITYNTNLLGNGGLSNNDYNTPPENAEVNNENLRNLHTNPIKANTQSDNAVLSYPTLKAIAMKNLPSSETEWVVVYAFYASSFGENTFNRSDIINQYIESNRFDKTTTKRDLSKNMTRAIQGGYINPLTADYSILDEGINKAKEIISRTSSSSPRQKSVSKSKRDNESESHKEIKSKKNSSSGKNLKRITDIDFEPQGKESLKSYFSKYSPKNDNERNLLFVYYLQEVLKITGISYNHVYTCYDTLDLKVSENLPQTVRNAGSRTGWIEIKNSTISTTIKGNNQIKAWNKENSK